MKISNTSTRLKELMNKRNLRQVDILQAAQPYCSQYGIKLAKNDLSQYVNGKVEPGQEKLTILGLALNVSETWLMGYDVPCDRESTSLSPLSVSPRPAPVFTENEADMIRKFRCLDDRGQAAVLNVLEHEYNSLPGEKVNPAPKEA